MISARLAEYALAAALTGLCCWGAYSWAHDRGYSAAVAHYEPILAQVRTQAEEAEKRAKKLEDAAATINQSITTKDKQRAEDAIRQRDAARADRVRLAAALARCRAVPAVSGGSGSATPAPGDDERFRAADEALGELAYRCQRDADRLRAFQDWYRAIAAAQLAP